MDMTIDQQVALDEALIPYASRLRIGKSNFRLKSNISSKESTLQLVYDVLRQTPFYKVFLVTSDVLEIYMQEFWATAMIHHHFIRFKMDNKKHIVNLEYFREMLHICPRLPAYKEYYAVAIGAAPPKTKASVRKTKSNSDTTVTPPTAVVGTKLSTSAKQKQPAKSSKENSLTKLSDEEDDDDVNEGSDDQDDDDDQDEGNDDDDQDSDKEGKEFIHPKLSIHDEEETKDGESFDPIAKTPENSDDKGKDCA
nr:hypothetical protein [Tanacetum cinerariifolium]